MATCFSEAMLSMSADGQVGAAIYNMLCNEGDGALWALDTTGFALIEVAAAVIVVAVVIMAVKRVTQSIRRG